MNWFWVAVAVMLAAVAGVILRAMLRGRGEGVPAAAYDLQVYRDQLREIDRDLARGLIAPADAERTRTEISRRMLDADRALQAATKGGTGAGGPGVWVLALALLLALAAGSVLVYRDLGAPGYPDLPLAERIAAAETARATRPRQAEAEADMRPDLPAAPAAADPRYLDLVAQLRAKVAEHPTDLQGQELLARNEAALGNYAAAHAAQAQVIGLKGDLATAADFAQLAELMVAAAGGYVSPEAETALTEALRRDPKNGMARYYSGLMFAQVGRPDHAFRLWRALLEDSGPDDPWEAPLRAQILDLAMRAGVQYELPAPRGPSSADMEAAAGMDPEARAQMIRGMVDSLNSRLATDGGTAEDWARLIRAYGVLGETEAARAIWAEAAGVFAGREADMAQIRAAAEAAGVAE